MSDAPPEFVLVDSLPPSQPNVRRAATKALIELCQANPDQWVKVRRCATQNAANGAGYYLARRYGFEYATRNEDGEVWLYVRLPPTEARAS